MSTSLGDLPLHLMALLLHHQEQISAGFYIVHYGQSGRNDLFCKLLLLSTVTDFLVDQEVDTIYTKEQLLAMLIDLVIAGFTTVGTALDFLFLKMIMHQDVQRKLQKKID
ncbi:uncharacterized protein LOC144472946 [Augochlora pura]